MRSMNGKMTASFAALLLVGITLCCSVDDSETLTPQQEDASAQADLSAGRTNSQSIFHKGVGDPITKDKAVAWITNYTRKNADTPDAIRSHFFGTETFERLLNQKGVVGISIHYALNDEGVPQLLMVGVDENGKLMDNEGQDGWQDVSTICPKDCSEEII